MKQKPFHGAQQRCQSYCCLESAPLPPHRTGTGASAHHRDHAHGCAPGTGSERAHHSKHHHHHHDCTHGCETGASAHITTIAHHDRVRPPAPLHTHTDRVQQHWRPRVSWLHAQGRTATSSARACARTTEQVSEALPRARVDGYGTSAQRAHKCWYVRSRSGSNGTALCARLAARARHTRRPPESQEGGRRPPRPVSPPEECLRPRMREPAMGVRLAPGENANTTTIATEWRRLCAAAQRGSIKCAFQCDRSSRPCLAQMVGLLSLHGRNDLTRDVK